MTTLYVNYTETWIDGGDVCAGQENDDWASHEPSYYDFELKSITLENTSPYHETFEMDGEIPSDLWVVYVRYSTGNTFGSSYGRGHIESVFKSYQEARAIKEAIEADYDNNTDLYKPHNGCKPWTGYFEQLESVCIDAVRVIR